MIFHYLITAGAAIAFSVVYWWLVKRKKISDENKTRLQKGMAIGLVVFSALCFLCGEVALTQTVGLNIHSPFGKRGILLTVYSVFALWAGLASNLVLVTYAFFKDKIRSLTPLVKFFATIVTLVSVASVSVLLTAMDGAKEGVTLRGVFLALQLGLSVAICFSVWLEKYKTVFSWKSIGKTLLCILFMFGATVPVYVFQVLIGLTPNGLKLNDLTVEHRIVLYGSVLLPVLIGIVLSKFDYNHKRYALLYFSLGTMATYSYSYSFSTFVTLTEWPLHLCNTAMYIIPLCLMFKLNKVFYFTMFINVLGAFFAMAMPNTAGETHIFEVSSVQFWINHYCAFFMPILIIAMGMYERPKMKQFGYSLIGFGGYYLLVLFMNAYLTNWDAGVDFFFINSDFIADKLGQWALDLRDIVWTVELQDGLKMIFYPLYQALYFLVYVALSFAMWFLYELCFQTADLYVDIFHRSKKIRADRLALEVSLGGRNISEPLNMEGTNKLILRNFSKQYATSDVYAVHNANLEIEGGQIFGFLGPNGAGKSTIIKSIVGIQGVSSGSIEVCGYDVERQPVGAKLQIGFVPDHYALYENLTGREYVNYIADLYNVSKEDRAKRIEEYVDRFSLHGSFDNPIKTYSHGMKQKITIMSALVHDPKLWILDEPLTGLDPESIFQVKEAMKAHAAAGNIVFFSSHIIDVVERICDRIAIIKKGHILCETSVKALEEKGIQLEHFYMDMIENGNPDATPVGGAETNEETDKVEETDTTVTLAVGEAEGENDA